MKNLTDRQKQILLAVIRFIDRKGYPPSLREIGEEFQITVKMVYDFFNSLQRKGYITRSKQSSRNIRVNHDRIGYTEDQSGGRAYYVCEEIKI